MKTLIIIITTLLIVSPALAADIYTKVDENTLKVTKSYDVMTDVKQLKERIARAEERLVELDAQYAAEKQRAEKELYDYMLQLSEAVKLGIKEVTAEVNP